MRTRLVPEWTHNPLLPSWFACRPGCYNAPVLQKTPLIAPNPTSDELKPG